MKYEKFLELLIKTGTGDLDLIKLGCTKMQIKSWKKGKQPVPGHIYKYLLDRAND